MTEPMTGRGAAKKPDRFVKLDPKKPEIQIPPPILEAELRAIGELRTNQERAPLPKGIVGPSRDLGLVGLAISGGGIRSATFALGVMQALARENLLRFFDYLSTVSGGGYIGSALTWLTSGQEDRQFGLGRGDFPFGTDPPGSKGKSEDSFDQVRMLRFLRQHGKYLTPGAGITATSSVAVFLRGMLLNLLVWLPIGVGLMMLLLWPSAASLEQQAEARRALEREVEVLAAPIEGLQDLYKAEWSLEVCAGSEQLSEACAQAYARLEEAERAVERVAGPPVLFKWMLIVASILAGFFLFACIVYSLVTFKRRRAKSSRYNQRRWFESFIRSPIWLVVVLLVVGTLPAVSDWVTGWIAQAGGLGSVLAGMLSGLWAYKKTGETGGAKDGKKKGVPIGLIVPVGAALLIYGVLFLSFKLALYYYTSDSELLSRAFFGLELLSWVFFGILAVALLTGYFVNLNYISLHRFYRDRLMETFMPDVPTALAGETGPSPAADGARVHELWKARGPYHIVNTNAVLVDSKDRTFRTRGGDNFILSPLYSGSGATGWRRTEDFMRGSMTLATAMAVSGAAANPNTGVGGTGLTRNKLVSLLMNLLNLRLGYWAPNPAIKRQQARANHFLAALYELAGRGYREDRRYIQISDGGHFENLALYELIRRRLKLIIVTDGGADPTFTFSDLALLMRRIGADFGARILFPGDGEKPESLIPLEKVIYPKDARVASKGYLAAKIVYRDGSQGDLIYLKTTLIKDLNMEILGYKGGHREFPDEPTSDQFFDERQFEAYRELGHTIGSTMIEDLELREGRDQDGEKILVFGKQKEGGPGTA